MTRKPILLCILDGWGLADISPNNPIGLHAPKFYDLFHRYPSTVLDASGLSVGLPQGQMGNSEVGHTTMGLGRVCMQDLPRISQLIDSKELFQLPAVTDMIITLRHTKKACHLMGLLSSGGVHAHQDHIEGILDFLLNQAKISVEFHAILDGRDSPPQSALGIMQDFLEKFLKHPLFNLASISGRYYAMDRDNRFERTEQAYNNILGLSHNTFDCALNYIQASYALGVTDEFILPARSQNFCGMHDQDALWVANFRADRVRQILNALLLEDFTDFKRKETVKFSIALGMNAYSDILSKKTILQPLLTPIEKKNTLGDVLSKHGLRQLRIAETEKYPHVTYFFNGGFEGQHAGEDHLLIPSPKVATYDLLPEMAAQDVVDKAKRSIAGQKYDIIVLNFANADMVGHTGKAHAVTQAVKVLDDHVSSLAQFCLDQEWIMLITADHGNAEQLNDPQTQTPHTAHTTNLVPFILVDHAQYALKSNGTLSDIAPTILKLLDIDIPAEMTGAPLMKGYIAPDT